MGKWKLARIGWWGALGFILGCIPGVSLAAPLPVSLIQNPCLEFLEGAVFHPRDVISIVALFPGAEGGGARILLTHDGFFLHRPGGSEPEFLASRGDFAGDVGVSRFPQEGGGTVATFVVGQRGFVLDAHTGGVLASLRFSAPISSLTPINPALFPGFSKPSGLRLLAASEQEIMLLDPALGQILERQPLAGSFLELGLKRAQETQIQTVVTRNLGAVEVAGANPVVRVDVRLSSGDIQSFRLDGGSLRPWAPAPEARKTEFVAFVRAAGNVPIARFPYASEIVFEKGLYFYNRVAEAARPLPLQAFRREQVLAREVMVHNHPAVWVSNGHDFVIVHQRTGATLYHSKDSESWRRLATGQIKGVASSLNGREIALAVDRKVIVYDLWSEVIPEPKVIFYRERVRFGVGEGQNQRQFHWVNGQFTLF